MFPVIGPVATTNDVTYVTPSYVVDHSPSVGQARHFRSWPRGWINRIGPVATTNDVTYVTPSYVVDHSPSVGQARHFRSWPRGWINRIGPVAIFNVSGPSYEIVYMPELGHLLCVCRVPWPPPHAWEAQHKVYFTNTHLSDGVIPYRHWTRPGRSLCVVAGDTVFGVQKASHIPVLFGGRGQCAALGQSPSGFRLPHPHTHTRARAHTPHSVTGGKQPGARSAAHPARRGWEGGQTTTIDTERSLAKRYTDAERTIDQLTGFSTSSSTSWRISI